ncbi:hypothetical protein DFP72DRAFT_909389 [Ephemerocybe angulata]|uniref:F-box domain-containing protein n=1 Tax=Ephemerocybe angulata TaxID=980116 RepID=A0A8H6M0F2_9AGAR|nr:hypothetical protein DFP72DRAFT_909389 [Tulosesus angulatus]
MNLIPKFEPLRRWTARHAARKADLGQHFANQELIPSPVPRLLQCNDSPTEEEKEMILEYVATIEPMCWQLPDSSSLTTALRHEPGLPHHYSQLYRESLRLHRSLITGIRNIPGEVLDIIFNSALQIADDRYQQLIRIMQTCKRWWISAHGSPRLWSTLPKMVWDVHTSNRVGRHGHKVFDLLKRAVLRHLAQSGNYPLTFVFHYDFQISNHTVEVKYQELLGIMISQSHRWGHADLMMSLTMLETTSIITGKLPLLRSLSLSVSTTRNSEHEAIYFFAACPSLEHVSLTINHTMGQQEPPDIVLPWRQLTTFNDHRRNIGRSCTFIKGDPNSQNLSCRMFAALDSQSHMARQLSRFSASRITMLDISSPDISCIPWLSDTLTLPSLTVLHLGFPGVGADDLSSTHLLSFVRRSRCSLKSLRFTGGGGLFREQLGAFSQFLLLSDELEELHCDLLPLDALRTLFFDPKSGEPPPVPRLRRLSISINLTMSLKTLPSQLDCAALNAVAKSRCNIGGRAEVAWLRLEIRAWNLAMNQTAFHLLENDLAGSPVPVEPSIREEVVKGWIDQLYKVGGTSFSGTDRISPSYHKQGRRLNELIAEMELYPIPDSDLVLFRKYDMAEALTHCASVEASRIPCASLYNLPSRLKSLKDRFCPPLLERDGQRHWAFGRGGITPPDDIVEPA